MCVFAGILDAVDRYAPSNRWHIDTLITMLSIAGSTLPDERISSSLIILIQRNPELHAYVVHKLFWALHDDVSQLSLVHVGLWCVGEYSKLLLLDAPASEDTLSEKARVDETTVVQLFKTILRHHVATDTTRAYALTAMAKLTTRFRSSENIGELHTMIKAYNSSTVLELQQRSTEYLKLSEPQWSSLRSDILATMPAIDASKIRNRNDRITSSAIGAADLLGDEEPATTSSNASSGSLQVPAKPQQQASLLDLDDIFGGGSASNSASSASVGGAAAAPTPAAVDLLADIFSTGPSSTASAPPSAPAAPAAPAASDLLGLLDFGAPAAPAAAPTPALACPPVRAYEKNGLTVDLEITKPNKDDASVTFITATTRNGSATPVDKFVFLAAFPKYIKLKMEPPNGDALPPHNGGAITQVVKIQNTMQGEVRIATWVGVVR